MIEGAVVNRECRIKVELHKPPYTHGQAPVVVDAVIDTGATTTAIRADIAMSLQLVSTDQRECYGANGTLGLVDCAAVFCGFRSKEKTLRYRVIEVVIMPAGHDEMLLGMDLLDGGYLEINGPANSWRWEIPPK